jgi:predicted CXXCH cytochrome family protein
MRRTTFMIVLGALMAVCLFAAAPAFAYDESTSTIPSFNQANCGRCHQPYPAGVFSGIGVHGGYSTTTSDCTACHTVHTAPANGQLLLPGPTYSAMCFTCHDGTQGRGVYGTIAARGLTVSAAHSFETTNVVPGGNPVSGQDATMTFAGLNHTLTCVDCHNPHGANTVAAFQGERNRISSYGAVNFSNRLLRKNPGSSTTTVSVYGSDWCADCHKGRLSGSAVHNHPVDSLATTTTPFTYSNVALLASDAPTSATVTGTLAGSNRGYVMPFPRTAKQGTHLPICQQCHTDPRFAGSLDTTGSIGDAATYTVDGTNIDGTTASDNPRFQVFPHESTGLNFLIEQNDDLCMNCHPVSQLP